ncbi:MAG: GNAT family N-acetyltransferase, partial [Phenylobacterium sp.]
MDGDQDLIETIDTERLRLRCPRAGDAAALAASLTPEVTSWLNSWPVKVDAELAAQRIEAMRVRLAENRELRSREFLSFMIERRSDGRLLGGISAMIKPEYPNRAEIGYHL